jgi:hypothetical protein
MADIELTDYQKTGKVELKKEVISVMILAESGNAIIMNEDIYEMYFVEDIFKFSITGKLVFNDRYNFLEAGPFTGQERIAFIYGVGESDRNMVFDIWKVNKISQSGPGIRETSENMFELILTDPFFIPASLRRYSKSWKDTAYSQIMRDILNNMFFVESGGFDLNIEDSGNSTDFIIPYWTPKTALNFLSRRAKGKRSGTSGYLIFNNTVNGITTNALSMNYLLSDFGKTLDKVPYVFQSDVVSGKNKILEWWFNGLDRTSNQVLRGGYWRGFDFNTKKLLQVGYKYSDGVDKNVMLGRKTLFGQMDDLNSSNILVGDNDIETLSDIAFNDWTKRYNMQLILNIIVEGDENRHAGQHIEIEWPGLEGETKMNDALKGKYMIKSVTHNFQGGGHYPYKQRLVCIKNSYQNINSILLYDSKVTNLYTEKNQPNIVIRR